MRTRTKVVLALAAVVVLCGCTVLAAGSIGFAYGFAMHGALVAPTEANLLVAVLQRLRAGKTDAALTSLELQLDTRIIEHGLYLEGGDPVFDFFRMGQYAPGLMEGVVTYRSEHPSDIQDAQIAKRVSWVLSKYATNKPASASDQAAPPAGGREPARDD